MRLDIKPFRLGGPSLLISLFLAFAACGPASQAPSETGDGALSVGIQRLAADNGLNANGLNVNGLNVNGLNVNGLNVNGLSTAAFKTWFNQNVTTSAAVMKYLYACAAPTGATLNWKNPVSGVVYNWSGVFGLATAWVSGRAPVEAEQQLVTGCLAAHVNKYGFHIPIAVEGRTATGAQIPIGPTELATYSIREACFFGNLFTGEGVYGGPDHSTWNSKTSTARACVFDPQYKDSTSQCPPIYQIGYCSSSCTPDSTKTFYETCTVNGKAYRAVATRIQPSSVYQCGDGVCQPTESCGSGADWDNCKSDCGLCP
jgi:hypothetical protein